MPLSAALPGALAAALMLSILPAPPAASHMRRAKPGTAAQRVLVTQPRPDGIDRRLRQAWEQLEVVVEQYDAVRDDLRATRARAAGMTVRMAALRDALRTRQARVGDMAADAYRGGRAVGVGSLLAATSPEQFIDHLLLIQRLASQQALALGALGQASRDYGVTRAALDDLASRQRQHRDGLARRKRHIEQQIRRLERLRGWETRWAAPPARPAMRPAGGHAAPYAPGRAGKATGFAYAQLGKLYQWGADGPHTYDCSGLTLAAWRAAGVRLPHNSARQWGAVDPVSRAELRPGDIVFYYADIHHVGLYVGGGRIIHAPSHGQRIRVESITYGAPVFGFGRP